MKKMSPEELKGVILESGIKVKPVYRPEDIADLSFDEKIGHCLDIAGICRNHSRLLW